MQRVICKIQNLKAPVKSLNFCHWYNVSNNLLIYADSKSFILHENGKMIAEKDLELQHTIVNYKIIFLTNSIMHKW